uniref:Metalloendopeptidase n=1 Tax=Strongyloides venezuelensis TaxID=75913 RepID=A0A0K0FXB9_STRVS
MTFQFIILLLLFTGCLSNYDGSFVNDNEIIREKRGVKKHSPRYPTPIPYSIEGIKNVETIEKSFADLKKLTCLSFIKNQKFSSRGILFRKQDKNRVNHLGASATEKTIVGINSTCLSATGCVKHMIGLALGLDIETNRHDRDKYIEIFKSKIRKSDRHWYKKNRKFTNWVRNTGFDYGSLMAAPITWKSIDGQPVFKSKLSKYYDYMVGQRYDYSFNDIKQINDFYCGDICKSNKIRGCTNGGYPDSKKKCKKCRCPDGFTGQQCTSIKPNRDNCGKRIRKATRQLQDVIIDGKKNCFYYIRSPRYTKIRIIVTEIKTKTVVPCYKDMGLEIKYRHNKGTTGLCLCGNYRRYALNPFNSRVLVHYKGQSVDDKLHLRYQMV